MCIEEERCKILQMDSKLEEILDTKSYFVDRSQEILEILTRRIVWIETNEEPPLERFQLKIGKVYSKIMIC